MARRLAEAAALTALAATAACGGGDNDGHPSPEPTETVSTGSEEDGTETPTPDESGTTSDGDETDGQIFLGSDSEEPSASDIELPPTQVGKPVQGDVDLQVSKQERTTPLQDVKGTIEGEEAEMIEKCLGEVPPEGCNLIFQYTPTQPGPYTGELTLMLADGSTITAAIHGEATEGPTPDTGPTTPESTTDEPTTDEPITTEPPTSSEDETPAP
ncbi:hypothetical protein AQI88_10630 [Streptomyces cellostaticus]|uniref:Secreted protein n=2 Tax=Streptomyces cellostaticus TaxID=67285 RepID=A0A101NP87_9ACTN|nr:hypothetical protein AQI88_10630 [Streptomyces cellostaticus]